MNKDLKKIQLLDRLIDLGGTIREKLDKRGFSGVYTVEDVDYEGNIARTENEVVSRMREFLVVFEELKKNHGC